MEWIGYAISLRTCSLGISEKRREWLRRWLADRLRECAASIKHVEEALGRPTFVSGALWCPRPVLGPRSRKGEVGLVVASGRVAPGCVWGRELQHKGAAIIGHPPALGLWLRNAACGRALVFAPDQY